MNTIELIMIGIGLAMDAFAVSVCKGLKMKSLSLKNCLIVGGWFGLFQAGMPLVGFFLGKQFENVITAIDHWIAFILLGIIGVNMIREAYTAEECSTEKADQQSLLCPKDMLPLAVATSIDALAVGITLAFLKVRIGLAVGMIGCITFFLSAVGVVIGHLFGNRFSKKAEVAGGLILIGLGVKILLEHLGFLG